jgi:hypothetical protein
LSEDRGSARVRSYGNWAISITTDPTEKERRASGTRACSRTLRPGVIPSGVTAYFAGLYAANYRDAAEHDGPGKVILFEGGRITLAAHIAEYPEEYHSELRKVLTMGDDGNPDRASCSPPAPNDRQAHPPA